LAATGDFVEKLSHGIVEADRILNHRDVPDSIEDTHAHIGDPGPDSDRNTYNANQSQPSAASGGRWTIERRIMPVPYLR
jgi:hypothetical protein